MPMPMQQAGTGPAPGQCKAAALQPPAGWQLRPPRLGAAAAPPCVRPNDGPCHGTCGQQAGRKGSCKKVSWKARAAARPVQAWQRPFLEEKGRSVKEQSGRSRFFCCAATCWHSAPTGAVPAHSPGPTWYCRGGAHPALLRKSKRSASQWLQGLLHWRKHFIFDSCYRRLALGWRQFLLEQSTAHQQGIRSNALPQHSGLKSLSSHRPMTWQQGTGPGYHPRRPHPAQQSAPCRIQSWRSPCRAGRQ